ncbi:MAG: inositol monophosphatase family protein [Rhodospirillales bacterium]|jgi:fructose-1,6-bisphosphatase/inositol monophosphatase family enzyme|nr:inositol monophosphatase family protein [Rhodospirillales bacterium]
MTSQPPLPDSKDVTAIMEDVAAREIVPRFRRLADHDITEKNPGDLVTTADIEAERDLARELPPLAAGSVVVGEEEASTDPSVLEALAGARPVWLIDPLDGTNNFAHGKPCFAVIIALCQAGEVRAGWIHDPLGGLTAWAIAGEGAWIRESGQVRRLSAAAPAPVSEMKGSLGRGLRKRLAAKREAGDTDTPARMVRYRCVGQEYMDLARGRLHFARYGGRLKPWDHAAGVLLHREAGGFSALVEGRAPYSPRPGIVHGSLLLAPDTNAWDALHRVMNGV